jgi:hypothetical protein
MTRGADLGDRELDMTAVPTTATDRPTLDGPAISTHHPA